MVPILKYGGIRTDFFHSIKVSITPKRRGKRREVVLCETKRLTAWNRVLENLTVTLLFKKFLAVYGT
jgi:hypothetical protein